MDALVTILAVILGWSLSEVSSWIQNIRQSTIEQKDRIDRLGLDVYLLNLDAASWAQRAFRSREADLDDDQRIIQLTGRAYSYRAAALRLGSEIKRPPSRLKSLFSRENGQPSVEGKRLSFIEDHSDRLCSNLLAIRDVMGQKSWGHFELIYARYDTLLEMSGSLERLQDGMARYLAADDQDIDQAIRDATSQAKSS